MKNIIVISDKGQPKFIDFIPKEECNVRVISPKEIETIKTLNPYILIFDMDENKFKEIAMVMKFSYPTLIVNDKIIEGITIRAFAFDYIFNPINEHEFKIRFNNLLKIKELKDTAKAFSITDELTGLHNRKYLYERLEAEISRARRYGTKLSALLLDIDFFKTVNDIYGYDWGDILLKRIAEMLKNLIRKEDILTRYGDEEFLLILPNTDEENAYIFAERFRNDIEKMEFIPAGEEERHPITISGGISAYPFIEDADENANTLIRYSEHALYNAKKTGKNKIVRFSQMDLG